MKRVLAIMTVAACLCTNSLAAAQDNFQELNADTAAERAQQGTQAYNPAVPQGCDAVEQGYCIRITKERDVDVPPDNATRPEGR